MFRATFKNLCLAFFLLLALIPEPASLGAPLRYKWQPGQKFGYEVIVTADLSNKLDTYKGAVLYEVKSVEGETVRIMYEGGVAGASKKKGSEEAAKLESYSSDNFGGLKMTNTELVLSTRGQVVGMKAESQLPYMLGNLSSLVFEIVPDKDLANWSVEGGLGIKGKGKTSAATTLEQFKAKSTSDGKSVFTKTYSLKSSGEESLKIEGTGTWTFDRATGMSESLDYSQTFTIEKGNLTITTPVQVTFRLLSSQERDQVEGDRKEAARQRQEAHDKFWADRRRAEDEAKRIAEAPLTVEEKSATLAALKPSAPADEMLKTLAALKKKTPKNPDPAIVEALRANLKHKDDKVRMAAEDQAFIKQPVKKANSFE